uniref:Rho guanine nucleotide exchange factor (GEF) 12a n=1 Tax=Pygocentrus nattereri TaxID=42514 RepID=A0AAR2JEW8_PYGNA
MNNSCSIAPVSVCRTSSILSRDHPPDKRPKSDKPAIPPVHDSTFDSTGLVQRCVIIQKDENGFGLTVSGDNPVFVQLVKEDGAAMRAGVQTGDRIIKVNGTLVTHSNHVEVVKLIKSGSYVALTVLGRPPGLPQIPLSEVDLNLGPLEGHGASSTMSPHSPRQSACNLEYKATNLSNLLIFLAIQEAKKHISQLQSQLNKATQVCFPAVLQILCSSNIIALHTAIFCLHTFYNPASPESICQRDSSSPRSTPRDSLNSCPSPETEDTSDLDSHLHSTVGSPSFRMASQIIGAEDDYFDSEQEQLNGQCSCFQSMELLKSRPAHLAAFLHHVVSQFEPAPVLCYLYADLYKQANSKETRRIFLDFLTLFIDRGANLKVTVPESISSELGKLCLCALSIERRRPELIPEDLHRQFVQTMQDALLPEVLKILEDFRQKRNMGLTLADLELAHLDAEQIRDSAALERERFCAENILSKIDDLLRLVSRFLISWRSTEAALFFFFPGSVQKSSKPEKEGEEKVKKPRFNILGPSFRPIRIDAPFGNPDSAAILSDNLLKCFQVWDSSSSLSQSRFPSHSLCLSIFVCFAFSLRLEEVLSEDDGGGGVYSDVDPPNWQQLVGREVLAGLTPHEIKRQEVINELLYTERAHVRMLKVLDNVFYQKLTRDNILPPADIKNIFTNLEEIIQLHVTISEQMAGIRKRNESSVVDQIGDDLLSWFSGGEEEKMKRAVGTFCSNQPFALELIKSRQKKDQRFITFMQEAESNRLCRRLQLKDIIPAEMQRLTKYPLLLENIAKYTDDIQEKDKVRRAADCCRKILNHVNQAVKESENTQRLEDYQRRLDLSSLKQSENPLISEFKNLDLTKRKLIHEGPLTWKLNKDKTVELYTLLLEDVLVLLQKQDERLILKCHSKNRAGTVDTQHIFSPVIKLSTVLVRSVATDNRSFFVLSMSDNGAQIYELMAQTLMAQEDGERLGRPLGGRLLRTTSLRTPVEHSSGRSTCRAQDAASGDTGFYEGSEDYAGYLVLEGYGGSGESSTDDDVQVGGMELGLSRGCAADSGISLRFSSASVESMCRLSRQVLTHLRDLQANLKHLKVESRYYSMLRQRHEGSSADTGESRGAVHCV